MSFLCFFFFLSLTLISDIYEVPSQNLPVKEVGKFPCQLAFCMETAEESGKSLAKFIIFFVVR